MLRSVVAVGMLASTSTLLLLSCTGDPPPDHEPVQYIGQSIMGGEDDPADPSVVGIIIWQGMNVGLCSGTLIAPNLVLTARHCVAETQEQVSCTTSTFGSTYGANSFFVTTEWKGPEIALHTYSMQGNWYQANRVVVTDQNEVCGNDMAMIQLEGGGVPASVATPIIPRVDENVFTGEPYTAIGFGAINDVGSGSGRRRILEGLSVSCVGNCMAFLMDLEHEWEGDHGVCQGDSGGPAFDSQGRLVGVVSRGGAGCTSPIYGGVFAWSDWIRQTALEAAQAGGYEPAPWVTGTPTEPDAGAGGSAGQGGAGGQGGAAGMAGEGGAAAGAGGDPGDPGLAALGQPCQDHVDCESGLCVYENNLTLYCSQPCSAEDPSCPDGFTCNPSVGACFMPGGFGTACADAPCRSGLCVEDANGTYCSQRCSSDNPCPDPASCDEAQGACFLPAPPPHASSDTSTASGGCSTARVLDPTKPIPWILGFGLVVAGLARRRKRG